MPSVRVSSLFSGRITGRTGQGRLFVIMNMFSRFLPSGPNLEVFRFAVYVSMPIALMFWVGNNTHEKLNVVDFWPDPNRLNQIPKDRIELKLELARMREEKLAKQKLAAATAEEAKSGSA